MTHFTYVLVTNFMIRNGCKYELFRTQHKNTKSKKNNPWKVIILRHFRSDMSKRKDY